MKKYKRLAVITALGLSSCIFVSAVPADTAQATNAYTTIVYSGHDQIIVDSSLLNVRTGPGMEYQMIGQLKKGDVANVIGTMNDWLILHLPDNSIGVVKAEFVKLKEDGYDLRMAELDADIVEAPDDSMNAFSASDSGVQEMALLVNFERENNALVPLSLDEELSKVAQKKAEEMSEKSYLGHRSPTYGTLFEMLNQFNISYRYAAENIVANPNIHSAFAKLANSKNHSIHILSSRFTKMGIGICEDAVYGKIIVQIFAE